MSSSFSRQMENFCHNIAWLRQHYGLSKRKMAALLKIDIQSLNKLETGQVLPRLSMGIFFTVQDQFGFPPEILLKYRLGEEDTD